MEQQKEWNKKIGEKPFVCERGWEEKWELKKLKVWKLGKIKWENINKIGTMENWEIMYSENIRKIGSIEI